jgi:hypothetical protein
MRTRVNVVMHGILVAVASLPAFGTAAAALQCESRTSTRAEVTVYSTAPQFSTAHGWELGTVIATLPPGSPVRVCESRQIGFLDKKEWRRILFDNSGKDVEGWIYGVGTLVSARRASGSLLASLFAPSVAYAQEPGSVADTALPDAGGLWLYYACAFLAICLGMAAKSAFDWLEQGGKLVVHDYLIRTIPPLLVSPMVFLSLSQLAEVRFDSGHSLIVVLCTAFQSGFFWQTVLVRSSTRTESAPALMPVTTSAAVP